MIMQETPTKTALRQVSHVNETLQQVEAMANKSAAVQ